MTYNIIASTDPISDEAADAIVSTLAPWSPVVEADGTVVLTIDTPGNQNYALAFATVLLAQFESLAINTAEVMLTEVYDEVYLGPIDAGAAS